MVGIKIQLWHYILAFQMHPFRALLPHTPGGLPSSYPCLRWTGSSLGSRGGAVQTSGTPRPPSAYTSPGVAWQARPGWPFNAMQYMRRTYKGGKGRRREEGGLREGSEKEREWNSYSNQNWRCTSYRPIGLVRDIDTRTQCRLETRMY